MYGTYYFLKGEFNMSFQKKVMILSDVRTGVGSGILRFVSDGGRTVFNTSLHVDDVRDATMIIRIGDKILSFNAENGERNLGTLSLSDNIDCVIAKNGKTLYFGTTGNDKFRCFNLLSDFEKKTENRKKSAVEKQENPVEKTRKKMKTSICQPRPKPPKPHGFHRPTNRRKMP